MLCPWYSKKISEVDSKVSNILPRFNENPWPLHYSCYSHSFATLWKPLREQHLFHFSNEISSRSTINKVPPSFNKEKGTKSLLFFKKGKCKHTIQYIIKCFLWGDANGTEYLTKSLLLPLLHLPTLCRWQGLLYPIKNAVLLESFSLSSEHFIIVTTNIYSHLTSNYF